MTTAQRERLKDRDRFGEQATKLRAEGKLADAIAAAKDMLAIEREVLGEASEDAIGSLDLIASIQEQSNNWPAALSTRESVLNLQKSKFGDGHWQVIDARLAMQDTERQSRMTREQRQKLADEDRLNRRSIELYGAGQHGEAIHTASQALAIRKELWGEQHPRHAQSLNNLAILLMGRRDYAAARPLIDKALAIRQAVQGERHPEYALCLNTLATLLKSQGDFAGARLLYERALAIQKEALGERDPTTQAT